MKNLTPLKSIRRYCLECCNSQPGEVKNCPTEDCVFFNLRMGKKLQKGSLCKIIKQKCWDCGEGSTQEVRKCEITDCPLHRYRLGRSPAHQRFWDHRSHPAGGFKKKEGATHAEK